MNRLSHGFGSYRLASLALLVSSGFASCVFAQSHSNPLRSASAAVAKSPGRPAAVGTSVRKATSPTPHTSQKVASMPANSRHRTRGNQVVPATYGQRVVRTSGAAPSPLNGAFTETSSVLQGTITTQPPMAGEVLPPATMSTEQVFVGDMGYVEYSGEYSGGMVMDGGCGGCGTCDDCMECCLVPCPQLCLDDLSVFGGVQGFTGPKNRGQAGSFGFYEGFNWGSSLPCFTGCLSMQAGARFTQSSLSGTEFTPDTRNQIFLTAGIFRRVDWGLQGGVVFDYQVDDWYTTTKLTQLRAEIGWVFPCEHELGFWMTSGTDEETTGSTIFTALVPATVNERWEATDLYAFYYRHRFSDWPGASGRGYAGFTGSGDGLIGADFRVALGCNLSLESGFTYLVPKQSKGPAGRGNEEESWNVAIGLVWYPGQINNRGGGYNSPLFNVADNGSFMVDQVR